MPKRKQTYLTRIYITRTRIIVGRFTCVCIGNIFAYISVLSGSRVCRETSPWIMQYCIITSKAADFDDDDGDDDDDNDIIMRHKLWIY